MRKDRGFSTIEISIAIAIILIFCAIAVPSVVNLTREYRVTTAADRLAGEIQTARLLAVSRNTPFQLVIDRANQTFQVIDPGDPANPPRERKSLPTGVTFKQGGGGDILTFNSRGSLDQQNPALVTLGNEALEINVGVSRSGSVTTRAATY
jgi:prepilin-type N-terminal cleavage/methylation domain-containing protein